MSDTDAPLFPPLDPDLEQLIADAEERRQELVEPPIDLEEHRGKRAKKAPPKPKRTRRIRPPEPDGIESPIPGTALAEPEEDDNPIFAAWKPTPASWLFEAPPRRRYLFRHPAEEGRAPGSGDGFLPAECAGMLAAPGGVGKTDALISAGLCLITGRRWFNFFEPDSSARAKRVLLALAEENFDESWRRVYRNAIALELTDAEKHLVLKQLVVLPLHGQRVSLVNYGPAGVLVRTAAFDSLATMLEDDAGPEGWSLVAIDPLSRWGGPDVERDETAATEFVQVLETFTVARGGPAVIAAHHASKFGKREGSTDPRGSTALTDGCRWVATLGPANGDAKKEDNDVKLELFKSNMTRPMRALTMRRTDYGGLRVLTHEELSYRRGAERQAAAERAEERHAAKAKERKAKADALRSAVAIAIRSFPGMNTRDLEAAVREGGLATFTKGEVSPVASLLERDGVVRREEGLRGSITWYPVHPADDNS